MKNVVTSAARSSALGKYLVALSRDFGQEKKEKGNSNANATIGPRTSPKRQRLHILYLINDILHHLKHHGSIPTTAQSLYQQFIASIQDPLVNLFKTTARYDPSQSVSFHRRLLDLVDIWSGYEYVDRALLGKLRKFVENATLAETADGEDASAEPMKNPRHAPYIMPSSHGDLSAAYYELPAATLMPLITPNSVTPIQQNAVKPLYFTAGPADPGLVSAMTKFFKDVDWIFSNGDPLLSYAADLKAGDVSDLDELGQIAIRDEDTNEILDGETYYGWSRPFCENMRRRMLQEKDRGGENGGEGRRRRSLSRSVSTDEEDRGRKRRYSSSSASSYGGRDSSRYHSPPRGRRYSRRSHSRSPVSTSRPGPHPLRYPKSASSPRPTPSPSRSAGRYPPYRAEERNPYPQAPPAPSPLQHPPDQGFMMQNSMPMPVPHPITTNGTFMPPVPPNYSGPWPPPPPPPPALSSGPLPPFPPGGIPIPPAPFPMPPVPSPYQSMPQGFPPFYPPVPHQMPPGGPHSGQHGQGSSQWHDPRRSHY